VKKILVIGLYLLAMTGCKKNESSSSTNITTTLKMTINGQQSIYTGSTTTPSSNGAILSVENSISGSMYKLEGIFSAQSVLFLDFGAVSPLAVKTYVLSNISDYLFIVNGTKYQRDGTNYATGSVIVTSIDNKLASGTFTTQFKQNSTNYTVTGEFTNVVVSN